MPPRAHSCGPGAWTITPLARITASPVLYRDRLYVSVASLEEGAGTSPRYPCCTFRGSVVALRAAGGDVAWKTYTIAEPPAPTRLSPAGVQMHGPSGAGVWNAPTIDPPRNALYVGTGNNYSRPATTTSDAVMAMDLDSGKVLWTQQVLADDAWLPGCRAGAPLAGNCPENIGTRPRLRRVAHPEDHRRRTAAPHHGGQERGGLGHGPRPLRRRGVENARAHDARGSRRRDGLGRGRRRSPPVRGADERRRRGLQAGHR